jgi:hypothetical protein
MPMWLHLWSLVSPDSGSRTIGWETRGKAVSRQHVRNTPATNLRLEGNGEESGKFNIPVLRKVAGSSVERWRFLEPRWNKSKNNPAGRERKQELVPLERADGSVVLLPPIRVTGDGDEPTMAFGKVSPLTRFFATTAGV